MTQRQERIDATGDDLGCITQTVGHAKETISRNKSLSTYSVMTAQKSNLRIRPNGYLLIPTTQTIAGCRLLYIGLLWGTDEAA